MSTIILFLKKIIRWVLSFFVENKSKYDIYKIIKITPGGFHCWVDTSIGRIKKPSSKIPDYLFKDYARLQKNRT
jgi:hypothetical protein